jgi:speckle-type POZ protein
VRYGLERLKLICEDMLCDTIDTRTAATTLALTEQHGCRVLREGCIYFLWWIPGNLEEAMASDGFQHLKASCPSLVKAIVRRQGRGCGRITRPHH